MLYTCGYPHIHNVLMSLFKLEFNRQSLSGVREPNNAASNFPNSCRAGRAALAQTPDGRRDTEASSSLTSKAGLKSRGLPEDLCQNLPAPLPVRPCEIETCRKLDAAQKALPPRCARPGCILQKHNLNQTSPRHKEMKSAGTGSLFPSPDTLVAVDVTAHRAFHCC